MQQQRMKWEEICRRAEWRGQWLALDDCAFDAETGQPIEGAVVDADSSLVDLCQRIRANGQRHCAIRFCEN
ncbi:MAG: hypothetical protein NZ898_08535 [Myxococcota bacterium]|nr:hypothetical protein [Myxococcota bacterium]MDW8363945.1 hypothetical protein [Myxococcales bacterium]